MPAAAGGASSTGPADKEKLLSLGSYPRVSLAKPRERGTAAPAGAGGRRTIPSADATGRKRARLEATANDFETVAREWLENVQREVGRRLPRRHAEARSRSFVFPGYRPHARIAEVAGAGAASPCCARSRRRGHGGDGHKVARACGQVVPLRHRVRAAADRNPAADLRGCVWPARPKHMAALPASGCRTSCTSRSTDTTARCRLGLRSDLLALTFVRTN